MSSQPLLVYEERSYRTQSFSDFSTTAGLSYFCSERSEGELDIVLFVLKLADGWSSNTKSVNGFIRCKCSHARTSMSRKRLRQQWQLHRSGIAEAL